GTFDGGGEDSGCRAAELAEAEWRRRGLRGTKQCSEGWWHKKKEKGGGEEDHLPTTVVEARTAPEVFLPPPCGGSVFLGRGGEIQPRLPRSTALSAPSSAAPCGTLGDGGGGRIFRLTSPTLTSSTLNKTVHFVFLTFPRIFCRTIRRKITRNSKLLSLQKFSSKFASDSHTRRKLARQILLWK
ncbi:hypothetical protein PIB30_109726, partial [Stylosanthes scabra]|nr:hypothetical protein [Stylosanthes scabra]